MAKCEWCGGLGRVAAGGMTSHASAFWSPAAVSVRECRQCHGTGEAGVEPLSHAVPTPRRDGEAAQRFAGAATAVRVATRTAHELVRTLDGDWIVEVHGYPRLLAVLRFRLTTRERSGRFDALCDFGGPPGWEATGRWTVDDADTVHFSGVQSSPYLITTGYRWGATLDELDLDVLHGESMSGEPTFWRRTKLMVSPASSLSLSDIRT